MLPRHLRGPGIAALALITALVGTAHASLPGTPWRTLPWADSAGAIDSVGLIPAGDEHQAIGPRALATAEGTTYVVDGVHARVVALDRAGAIRVIPAGFRADDLVALGDDRLLALDARLDRVHRYEDGAWQTTMLPASAKPRGVAAGPAGGAWLVGTDGSASPLFGSKLRADRTVATPLGVGVPLHAVGRWLDPHRGVVLAWSWAQTAELKGAGPRLNVTVTADERLGLVRPIGGDYQGNLYVLVETIAEDGGRLAVTSEVRCYAPDGTPLRALSWQQTHIAPANRYVAVAPDGTLTLMASTAAGLALHRARLAPPIAPLGGPLGGVR